MIKEIGSVFPLFDLKPDNAVAEISPFFDKRVLFSLCREALKEIALLNSNSNKIVLIPAYTCQTVITPFDEAGWKTIFYPIKKDLRIDTEALIEIFNDNTPSLIVVHPFYGMDLNQEEESAIGLLKSKGVKTIIDLTQCIFSKKNYVNFDYQVGSYRKWFPIPDGAYLKCKENIQPPFDGKWDFSDLYSWAMYLRGLYFCNGDKYLKSISIALSKKADEIAESGISGHKISDRSLGIISKEDIEKIKKLRQRNFSLLHRTILDRIGVVAKVCVQEALVTTAPLYFTLYVEDRKEVQKLLAENAIYAPILWPVEDKRVLINNEVEYIYNHILAIPCDQRYREEDMVKVARIINNYGK